MYLCWTDNEFLYVVRICNKNEVLQICPLLEAHSMPNLKPQKIRRVRLCELQLFFYLGGILRKLKAFQTIMKLFYGVESKYPNIKLYYSPSPSFH